MGFTFIEPDEDFERTYDYFKFDAAIKLIMHCKQFDVEMKNIEIASSGKYGDTLSFTISGKTSNVKKLNEFIK